MQPTPAVAQAFSLDTCCNSLSTDPLETPPPKGQLTPPGGAYSQAVKAWRREWRVWVPGQGGNNPYRSPGLKMLKVGAQNNVPNKNYAAQGNILTLNIWDNQQPSGGNSPSTVSGAIVQVAAYCLNTSGQTVAVPPPIAQYCWGGGWGNPAWQTFPSYPSGQNYVQLSQPAGSVPLTSAQAGGFNSNPAYGLMYGVAFISFEFNSSITLPTSPSGLVNPIRLQVAIYATLTNTAANSSLPFYDDPEMDVDTSI